MLLNGAAESNEIGYTCRTIGVCVHGHPARLAEIRIPAVEDSTEGRKMHEYTASFVLEKLHFSS